MVHLFSIAAMQQRANGLGRAAKQTLLHHRQISADHVYLCCISRAKLLDDMRNGEGRCIINFKSVGWERSRVLVEMNVNFHQDKIVVFTVIFYCIAALLVQNDAPSLLVCCIAPGIFPPPPARRRRRILERHARCSARRRRR
jgi:hypothetical protein